MSIILIILAVIFLAALVKTVLGFGEALIAMPLLTLVIGIPVATPLVGLVSICMTMMLLVNRWHTIDMRSMWRLILAAALGMPIGLLLINAIPIQVANKLLGIILIVYSLYTLYQPKWEALDDTRWAYLFGFFSGVFGSAYNTGGPPMVIYASLRRETPEQFRATLQGFFLPTSVLIIIGQGFSGMWTPDVFLLFALSLPIMLVAFIVGIFASRYIPAEKFAQLVRVGLMILGVVLLLR